MTERLLPCPFCGGEAEMFLDADDADQKYLPYCPTCCGMVEKWFSTEQEAMAVWNRRAEVVNNVATD